MTHLAQAVIEAMAFLELSGDDVVDPDSAVSAMEMISAELQACEPEEVEALRKVSRKLARGAKGDAKKFFASFLAATGLEEEEDDEPDVPATAVMRGKAGEAKVAWDFIFHCCSGGDAALAEKMLGEHPSLVSACTRDGLTGTHLAAECGHHKVLKLLLARGADPDARTPQGDTPLHRAAYKRETNSIELLLRAGAKVNVRNKQGLTPLGIFGPGHRRKKAEGLLRAAGGKA